MNNHKDNGYLNDVTNTNNEHEKNGSFGSQDYEKCDCGCDNCHCNDEAKDGSCNDEKCACNCENCHCNGKPEGHCCD